MNFSAKPVTVDDISHWRNLRREEMHCQVLHDSFHGRAGWTEPYQLEVDGEPAGYGALVVDGPWKGTRTLFEFYVLPAYREKLFDLFNALISSSGATAMRAQTNDKILTVMLHTWARSVSTEKIVFEDARTTHLPANGSRFIRREAEGDWALEMEGTVIATGGIMYHYNRPYVDLYMEVVETYRRRGYGAYFVQELKRTSYEQGSIPCARCDAGNVASRSTLMKAGFAPCGNLLDATL
ncbi:GNAT family N-acetyltransferase [Silvibacterium acidisoli]|uniref:GNAT family N-acetyltransferase n=1 Tax=Acidobacteriaceae bacterium ZG23-2 TaxID=2883246 RepID=UPI00406CD4FC